MTAYPAGEALADGVSPASTHCGCAHSEIWACLRNDVWQNDRAAAPQ
jgi:hypothetical protein